MIQANDKSRPFTSHCSGLDDDADYPAVEMANFVLGGGGFTSRITERLRQKEGWSYGSGSRSQ